MVARSVALVKMISIFRSLARSCGGRFFRKEYARIAATGTKANVWAITLVPNLGIRYRSINHEIERIIASATICCRSMRRETGVNVSWLACSWSW